jgi:hypothetical protein
MLNPGTPLGAGARSYKIRIKEYGFCIQVMLAKKCYKILKVAAANSGLPQQDRRRGKPHHRMVW